MINPGSGQQEDQAEPVHKQNQVILQKDTHLQEHTATLSQIITEMTVIEEEAQEVPLPVLPTTEALPSLPVLLILREEGGHLQAGLQQNQEVVIPAEAVVLQAALHIQEAHEGVPAAAILAEVQADHPEEEEDK
jgi:hypothetical protein